MLDYKQVSVATSLKKTKHKVCFLFLFRGAPKNSLTPKETLENHQVHSSVVKKLRSKAGTSSRSL